MSKKKNGGFVLQAVILAAAGILVRIIGLLYGVPLSAIIGDLGNGYYSSAYNIYSIILMVCSYSIPMAVSKIISARRAFGEYKTAYRVFQAALFYVVIVGGLGSVITFLFAPQIVDVKEAVLALRILAPTIFFSGILSVYRGYFQAKNTMVPTAISQFIEQVINACVSVGAAYLLSRPYVNASDETLLPMYGAAGGALGTGAGVVSSLFFMLLLYFKNRKNDRKERANDTSGHVKSYKGIFKMILLLVTPVILSTCIYNISTVIDMKVYYGIMGLKGMADTQMASLYGIFSRKYTVLVNVPIALASAMASAVVPGISVAYEKGEYENSSRKIADAIRFTMLISIPAAVGMSILAEPIMELLFPGTPSVAATLLRIGSMTVVFYGVSTVTNGALQGIGKVKEPMKNATISLVAHLVILVPILLFTEAGLYGILGATILYSVFMCMLNSRALRKYTGYKQEWKQTFGAPLAAAAVMGIFTYASFRGCFAVLAKTALLVRINYGIGIVLSVGISAIIYFIALMKFGGFTEEQVLKMPDGKLLVKMAKKMRLLK